MIVDCAVYQDGRRIDKPWALHEAVSSVRDNEHQFVWIGLHEPTQVEFDEVAREFRLHRLAVEDAVNAHQRPKAELYADSLFLVLKPARFLAEHDLLDVGELMVFVGERFAITVRHGECAPLAHVREVLEQHEEILRFGPAAVLYAVCDHVVDGYLAAAEELAERIAEVEATVFSSNQASDSQRIYHLKRETLKFRRAAAPLAEPMRRLATTDVGFVPASAHPFFRDVSDHLTRVTDLADSFDRILADILSVNLTEASLRQNDDMRKISAWAAMVTVPTMIAGIYGMNFANMPELHWRYGYPIAVTLMVAICLALYRAFKRSGWL